MTTDVVPGLTPRPGLSRSAAFAEAHRCLMCWDAPCIRACPTAIDVPGFIKRIAFEDDLGAARVILEANILGDSCAHVCPTSVLCEGACVLNDVDGRPIPIGRLQGFATGPVVQGGIQLFTAAPATGKKIAVIGGGPAGLACAAELTKRGHEAVVFDAASKPGGLNTRGVAEYKQTRTAALAEIAWLQDLGVTVRENTVVGEDITFDELVSGYDAMFFGAGLGAIPVLGVPGESLAGVEDALRLIEAVKTGALAPDGFAGKTVVVLGGGNTAIDAARLAVRLGAVRTVVIYRRGPDEMPAYKHEVAEARREGVAFSFWSAPHSVIGDGKVEAVRCQRTEPGPVGSDGRPAVITSDEPPYDVHADVVVRATGQATRQSLLSELPDVATDGRGRIIVDEEQRTSQPGVWAGGDCVNGGKEVVNAVAEGMAAARSIDEELRR